MKELVKVELLGKEFQLYEQDGQSYFSAKIVGEILGYSTSNISKMVKNIDENEKTQICVSSQTTSTKARSQEQWFLTKKGFITVINSSRKLTTNEKEKIFEGMGIDAVITYSRSEVEFLDSLKKVLEPFGFECFEQYPVLNYRLDFYIKDLNVSIEFDEYHHRYNKQKDEERQAEIIKELGCSFVRVNERDGILWNCGYVLKNILQYR